jgi:hypothetical protein
MSLDGVVLPLASESLFQLMMDRRPGRTPTSAPASGGQATTGSFSLVRRVSCLAACTVADGFGTGRCMDSVSGSEMGQWDNALGDGSK